jgi:hypothetical protein
LSRVWLHDVATTGEPFEKGYSELTRELSGGAAAAVPLALTVLRMVYVTVALLKSAAHRRARDKCATVRVS